MIKNTNTQAKAISATRAPTKPPKPTRRVSFTEARKRTIDHGTMKPLIFLRILFQYLTKVDMTTLHIAKAVLVDCEQKHSSQDSKYESLSDAINERLRDAIGEVHWMHVKKIEKRVVVNQRIRKMAASKKTNV